MKLAGKVAVVTGAGSGIGRASAIRLATEGASVVVTDIDPTAAERVAGEIRSRHGAAMAVRVDVSREEDIVELMRVTGESFGRLDVLHNNAALTDLSHKALDTTVVDASVDVWERTFAVNLRGPLLGCKHGIPLMLRHGGGSIINTSSAASRRGAMRGTAYGTSKAALNALTVYVATQYGRNGIRCNAVLPGLTLTPAASRNLTQTQRDGLLARTPLGRAGEPEDVAAIVLFLASDESRQITGQLMNVTGGAEVVRGDVQLPDATVPD